MTQAMLVLRAAQQTTLTPRLQQSVRLLQLSSHDFAQELEQALATNPFLDVPAGDEAVHGQDERDRSLPLDATSGTMDSDSFVESIVVDATIAGASGVALVDQRSDNAEPFDGLDGGDAHDGGDIAFDGSPDLDGGSGDPYDFGSFGERSMARDDADVGSWAESAETLRTHLHAALVGHRLTQRDQAIVELVIEALDDDGYLRQELDDVVSCFAFDPPVTSDELAVALKLVQQLGPAGIAARSVSECLALQLEAAALDDDDEATHRSVAATMVRDHIDRVANHDWVGIRRSIGCSLDAVLGAADLIRGLNPRPGSAFGNDLAQAVIPDVIVRRLRNGWHTDINPAVIPRLCLNRVYAALYHESRSGDRQPLGQQLQEARWLLRNAAQRFVTIRRVARVIVAEQAAFLDYGDIATKPLLLRQVADRLGLHESTISRAIGNKFMATPRGVFAFKHFFSRKLATVSGGTCSATSIRAAMRELIEREDRAEPMSDVELARRLTEQGLCVARRTVTKYRGLMRIPPVETRKRAEARPTRSTAANAGAAPF